MHQLDAAVIWVGPLAMVDIDHFKAFNDTCRNIDSYKVMLRDTGRPRHPTPGKAKPVAAVANKWISVTISIGVAERGDRLDVPEAVSRRPTRRSIGQKPRVATGSGTSRPADFGHDARGLVMDYYKLLLYTRLFQEETFCWRPGLGFSRLVTAMVRRL